MKLIYWLLLLISSAVCAQETLPLNQLTLPPHFKIEIYAKDVKDARDMALGAKGTVFVGTRYAGNVYAITPDKHVLTIAKDLKKPHGVAFKNGALYVSQSTGILRYDAIEEHLNNPPKPVVVSNDLPDKGGHNWRTIGFGPDDKLYISIGAPCNICLEKDERFASIIRMNPDGTQVEVYARGIRDSVGFDWDPKTKALWFTDNGRDWMGDDTPPDELDYAPTIGMNFGFPFCHGGTIPDPSYGKNHPCSQYAAPIQLLPAHVAALDMIFYTGNMFPAEYRDAIFIAEHGSWNRSKKDGYQVITSTVHDNKLAATKPFITGWLQGQKVWGRPVGFLTLKDGSLLISDDYANVIYRVTYGKN